MNKATYSLLDNDNYRANYKQGFPNDCLINWIKPIFKVGDKNQVSNYRTIMVASIIAKLYRTIMEQKISAWAESTSKRALGKARFRPKHSIVDHLVNRE